MAAPSEGEGGMTTPMLEKMARAICKNHGVEDPDQLGPGQTHVIDRDGVPTIISDHRGPLWNMWIADAQAALQALAEPTEEMFDAVSATELMWRDLNSRKVFTAMIHGAMGRHGGPLADSAPVDPQCDISDPT